MYIKVDGGWTNGSLTLDKHSRQVWRDVLGDPQGVPGVNGPIGENDSAGADVVAAVMLIGLGHGCCQQLCADVVKLCTLLHLKTKHRKQDYVKRAHKSTKRRGGACGTHIRGKPVNGWLGESELWKNPNSVQVW